MDDGFATTESELAVYSGEAAERESSGQLKGTRNCEDIPYGTSCRVAWAVGFQSANHTELSCLAIGKLERNSVSLYPVCEEKKCVDVATSDLSMLAQDCTDLTSGDQCNVMCAAGCTGSAITLTCTLDVVNGSVSLIGSLPKGQKPNSRSLLVKAARTPPPQNQSHVQDSARSTSEPRVR